jgi:hypothetical protein
MKRVICFVMCILAPFSYSLVFGESPSPIGLWQTIDDDTGEVKSLVRISEQGGALIGIVEKLYTKPGKDPNPLCTKCDGNNKDKPVLGMRILWGLIKHGDEWSGGSILDPKKGTIYKCTLKTVEFGRRLIVRGYIGFSLLGRSQTWNRVVD